VIHCDAIDVIHHDATSTLYCHEAAVWVENFESETCTVFLPKNSPS